MKQFLILAISTSSIFLTGCCGIFSEPKVVYDTRYIYQSIPDVPEEPKFVEYKFEKIQFNDKMYYIIDPVNAAILGSNWIDSETYTKNLQTILKSLKDSNISTR
jgi:hypothetical protein